MDGENARCTDAVGYTYLVLCFGLARRDGAVAVSCGAVSLLAQLRGDSAHKKKTTTTTRRMYIYEFISGPSQTHRYISCVHAVSVIIHEILDLKISFCFAPKDLKN